MKPGEPFDYGEAEPFDYGETIRGYLEVADGNVEIDMRYDGEATLASRGDGYVVLIGPLDYEKHVTNWKGES